MTRKSDEDTLKWLDYAYTEFAICPYCDYKDKKIWDIFQTAEECTEVTECEECGKEFEVELSVEYSFSTR